MATSKTSDGPPKRRWTPLPARVRIRTSSGGDRFRSDGRRSSEAEICLEKMEHRGHRLSIFATFEPFRGKKPLGFRLGHQILDPRRINHKRDRLILKR